MSMFGYVDGVSFWEPDSSTAQLFAAQVRVMEDRIQRSSGILGTRERRAALRPVEAARVLRVPAQRLEPAALDGARDDARHDAGPRRARPAPERTAAGARRQPRDPRRDARRTVAGRAEAGRVGPADRPRLPPSVRFELAAIVLDLVRGWYQTIDARTDGQGWQGDRLREIVDGYPVPLLLPPQRIPPDLIST